MSHNLTTAQYLGQFRSELDAAGINPVLADDLTRKAFDIITEVDVVIAEPDKCCAIGYDHRHRSAR